MIVLARIHLLLHTRVYCKVKGECIGEDTVACIENILACTHECAFAYLRVCRSECMSECVGASV